METNIDIGRKADMKNCIGKNIKKFRIARKMTQKDLANLIHVSPQAISKWENDLGMPDVSQLVPLSVCLCVSIDELFGREARSTSQSRSNDPNSNDFNEIMDWLGWNKFCEKGNPHGYQQRDFLGRLFHSYYPRLHKLISREAAEMIVRMLLGSDNIKRFKESPNESEYHALRMKFLEFDGRLCFQRKIIQICQIIGVTNLYDIGCEGINQGLIMIPYTNMTYTGISEDFYLRDWWGNEDSQNILNSRFTPYVEEAPPPFAKGRVSYIKGVYPDVRPEILPDSIAYNYNWFFRLRGKDTILRTASALHEDFDRIIMSLPYMELGEGENHWPTILAMWREADWSQYYVVPIGQSGFIYATRYAEDIVKLRKAFPSDEKGRIDTAIHSSYGVCGWWGDYWFPGEPYHDYLEW
jgi:transcriptional regulator with XRE-family HTH domain